MNYATACSGIDAPGTAWQQLGWRAVFHSEIEPFPCDVLAAREPDVPNLGNMEAITREQIEGFKPVSVFVAGTPCQSFSVAGLRKGMADPRGNLALVFLRLVDWLRPEHFVWENVPGFLSDEGGDTARAFLDAVEELGYVVDIDILDAQFFDVPQRRRRIFICAQSTESILRQKTISSALTISQCLMESLVLALAVLRNLSPIDWAENLAFDGGRPELSLKRRIGLFGLQKAGSASMLQENLDVLRQWCERGQDDSASPRGKSSQADSRNTADTKSRASTGAKAGWQNECLSIDTSWKKDLADCFTILNECITSTATNGTTESKIFTCARATLYIAAHITQSLDSSPCFWTAASSALTAVKGFTNYARSAVSSLFTNVEWIQSWSDFLEQAKPAVAALERLRVECFGKILPVSECLSGNPAPSREAGARTAACLTRGADSSGKGGYAGRRREDDYNIVNAIDTFGGGPDDNSAQAGHLVCGTLNANGKAAGMRQASRGATMTNNRSEGACSGGAPGTGIGEPGDPAPSLSMSHTPAVAYQCQGSNVGPMGAIRAGNGNEAGGVPFIFQTRCSRNGRGMPSEVAPALTSCEGGTHADTKPHVSTKSGVRRLMPIECERLQGFPDSHTAVKHRGKPASDAPRYKAIGNSMCVNVMLWIGKRIQLVNDMETKGVPREV